MNKIISKFAAFMAAAFMLMAGSVGFSFSAVSCSASAEDTAVVSAVAELNVLKANVGLPKSTVLVQNGNDNSKPNTNDTADSAYQTTIEFFLKWLTRAGMIIGLIGAIMFALAIKENDAGQKQIGILTMIAGFVVAAVCAASDMFHLFD